MVISTEVLLLLRIVFAILGFFVFPYEIENCCFHVFEELYWNFEVDSLNLQIAFGRMVIFTMLIQSMSMEDLCSILFF
jgi:hypothetical protein